MTSERWKMVGVCMGVLGSDEVIIVYDRTPLESTNYTRQTKVDVLWSTMTTKIPRSAEIDILRVTAILMMMVYHLAYDLHVFYGWGIDVQNFGWMLLQRSTACLFLLLTGLCFVISWQRSTSMKKYIKRGIAILCYGLVVSIATYLADPDTFVRFGILHLIGLSTVLLPLFVRFGRWNAVIGLIVIMLSSFLLRQSVDTSLLLLLGFMPAGFQSVDYFPLLPWFGVILTGSALGTVFTRNPERYRWLRPIDQQSNAGLRLIQTVSSHSLIIYMVHQPVFLVILKRIMPS